MPHSDGHNSAMERDRPLVRQWLILKTLSARRYGATVKELAEEMEVGEKTIRRDLITFQEVGFPIEERTERRGRKVWHVSSPWAGSELGFAFDEACALYLGRRLLEPLAGTLLWQAAQRAFAKIRACLNKPALAYLEKMAGHLHHTSVGASDYAAKGELIDRLMQAIEDRRATHVVYQSLRATEPVEIELHPYGLTYHRGSLYLVAFSRDHNELRHFKVDRMSEVVVSDFPFCLPDRFDLAAHFAQSFGVFHGAGSMKVKVRFLPAVARYVQEGRWHASQQLTRQKDGSLLAEFELSALEEVKGWLLSFGRHAEVLEPEELRKEMAGEVQALMETYSPDGRSPEGRSLEGRTPDGRTPEGRSPDGRSKRRKKLTPTSKHDGAGRKAGGRGK